MFRTVEIAIMSVNDYLGVSSKSDDGRGDFEYVIPKKVRTLPFGPDSL